MSKRIYVSGMAMCTKDMSDMIHGIRTPARISVDCDFESDGFCLSFAPDCDFRDELPKDAAESLNGRIKKK